MATNFKPTEVRFEAPVPYLGPNECSRMIATMDENGNFTVTFPTLYHEDCTGLLAVIAQAMAELTEDDPEELLRQARKSVKWNRLAERVRDWGRPQEAL